MIDRPMAWTHLPAAVIIAEDPEVESTDSLRKGMMRHSDTGEGYALEIRNGELGLTMPAR